MPQFTDLFGNFLFMALFISAGLLMVVGIQLDNNASQPMIENELFNESSNDLSDSLSSLDELSGLQYDQFTGEQPAAGFGSIVLFGIVAAGKNFGTVVLGTLALIIKLPLVVLGLPATLISTIVTWVIIVLIVSTWLLYKLGG